MKKIKQTQFEKVKARLEEVGYVDNFWAIKNYIIRLGAIMNSYKLDLPEVIGVYGDNLNIYTGQQAKKNKKNYHYVDSRFSHIIKYEI